MTTAFVTAYCVFAGSTIIFLADNGHKHLAFACMVVGGVQMVCEAVSRR